MTTKRQHSGSLNRVSRREVEMPEWMPQIEVKFQPRAVWIGVQWGFVRSVESSYRRLDLDVCAVPMLVMRLRFEWGWRDRVPVDPTDVWVSE